MQVYNYIVFVPSVTCTMCSFKTTCRKNCLSEHAPLSILCTKTYSSQLLHLSFPHLSSVQRGIFSSPFQFVAWCSLRIDLVFFVRVSGVAFAAQSLRAQDSRLRQNTSCCLEVAFNWMRRGKERSAMPVYFWSNGGRNCPLEVRRIGNM